jgi:Zn-finger nucleic acid-binding protein
VNSQTSRERSRSPASPGRSTGSLLMKCPRHDAEFEPDTRHGVEAERCPECTGIWIAPAALEAVEDRVFSEELRKGTLKYGVQESDLSCPHCAKTMVMFRYRAHDLELDHCPDDGGYWLDKDEDRRILELMRQRASDLKRSSSAQGAWHRALSGEPRGIFGRVRDMFR